MSFLHQSKAWKIDTSEIQVPSKRPHYIESRFQRSMKKARHASCIRQAPSPNGSTPRAAKLRSLAHSHALWVQRCKIRCERARKQREQHLSDTISARLSQAQQRRQEQLNKKQEQCSLHFQHVKIAQQTMQETEDEWRAHCARRLLKKTKIARRLTTAKSPSSRLAAALRIQQWFRRHRLIHACKQLHQTRIFTADISAAGSAFQAPSAHQSNLSPEPLEAPRHPTFHTVTAEIQSNAVLRAVRHVVGVLCPRLRYDLQQSAAVSPPTSRTLSLTGSQQPTSSKFSRQKSAGNHSPSKYRASVLQTRAKIILSAFLIAFHRLEIINGDTAVENHLFDCAVTLATTFQRWVRDVVAASSNVGEAVDTVISNRKLKSTIAHHVNAFQAWQKRDLRGLSENMVQHYKELIRLKESVSRHKQTRHEWHPHIDEQLQMIERRLTSLNDQGSYNQCKAIRNAFDEKLARREELKVKAKTTVAVSLPPPQLSSCEVGAGAANSSPSSSSSAPSSHCTSRQQQALNSTATIKDSAATAGKQQSGDDAGSGNGHKDETESSPQIQRFARQLAASWDASLLHHVCTDPSFRFSATTLPGGQRIHMYDDNLPVEPSLAQAHRPAFSKEGMQFEDDILSGTVPQMGRTAHAGISSDGVGVGLHQSKPVTQANYFEWRVKQLARKAAADEAEKQLNGILQRVRDETPKEEVGQSVRAVLGNNGVRRRVQECPASTKMKDTKMKTDAAAQKSTGEVPISVPQPSPTQQQHQQQKEKHQQQQNEQQQKNEQQQQLSKQSVRTFGDRECVGHVPASQTAVALNTAYSTDTPGSESVIGQAHDTTAHVTVLLSVLSDICTRLQGTTLPRHDKLRQAMKDRLNAGEVVRALTDGSLSFDKYRSTVVRYMKSLAAPLRDPDMRRVEASSTYAAFFFNSAAVLEQMQLDMANYVLDTFRPLIVQIGAQIERDRVQSLVFSGSLTFSSTKQWLVEVIRNAGEHAQKPFVAGTSSHVPSDAPKHKEMGFADYLLVGVENLLFADSGQLEQPQLPETLAMDRDVLLDARKRLWAISRTCAVYTVLSYKLPRLKHAGASVLSELRFTLLNGFMRENWLLRLDNDDTQDEVIAFAIAAIQRGLSVIGGGMLSEAEQSRLKSARFGNTTAVVSLLHKRVCEEFRRFVRSRTPAAIDLRSNNGLDLCRSQLRTVLLRVCRIIGHNRAVFAAVYNNIISGALGGAAEEMSKANSEGGTED